MDRSDDVRDEDVLDDDDDERCELEDDMCACVSLVQSITWDELLARRIAAPEPAVVKNGGRVRCAGHTRLFCMLCLELHRGLGVRVLTFCVVCDSIMAVEAFWDGFATRG